MVAAAVEEYVEETALFKAALLEYGPTIPRTLLELGSGGGNSAFYVKNDFRMTLVDLSEGMLRHSRRINPEFVHHRGDMRDVRLLPRVVVGPRGSNRTAGSTSIRMWSGVFRCSSE